MIDNREIGKHEVRYMVKDSSGNSAMVIRTVEVVKRPSGGITILEEEKKEEKEEIPAFIPKYNSTIIFYEDEFDYGAYSGDKIPCWKKIWFAILRFVEWLFGL
jgi:hypothetical protein